MIFDWIEEAFGIYKIVSVVISAIFLVLVIRFIILTDAFGGYRKYKLDVYKYGGNEKKAIVNRWKKILDLMSSKNADDWKRAALLAESMFVDIMKIESSTQVDVKEFSRLREVREQVLPLVREEGAVAIAPIKELLREYREAFKEMGYL